MATKKKNSDKKFPLKDVKKMNNWERLNLLFEQVDARLQRKLESVKMNPKSADKSEKKQ